MIYDGALSCEAVTTFLASVQLVVCQRCASGRPPSSHALVSEGVACSVCVDYYQSRAFSFSPMVFVSLERSKIGLGKIDLGYPMIVASCSLQTNFQRDPSGICDESLNGEQFRPRASSVTAQGQL